MIGSDVHPRERQSLALAAVYACRGVAEREPGASPERVREVATRELRLNTYLCWATDAEIEAAVDAAIEHERARAA